MRTPRATTGALVLAVGLLAAACSAHAAAAPTATPSPTQITITAAAVVQPVSEGAPAPAYFTVHNPTANDDRITSVTTPAATTTLINNSLSDPAGNPGIDIPAESTTTLGPFGTDVLLLKPAPLTSSSRITLTVRFAHHTPISVTATVETVTQAAHDQSGNTP